MVDKYINHDHNAKHDRQGRYHLVEQIPSPRWDEYSGEPHVPVLESRFDLVHDHGRGLHHHHLGTIDDVARLLYWGPADHGPDQSSRFVAQNLAWVRELMSELPPVISIDDFH